MARRRRNRIEEEAKLLRKQRREMLRERKVATERRKLMAALAPVLVLVFGFVLFGWFRLEWWQPRQPVARVAGTAITADTYGKRVQFARRQTLNNLSSLLGFLQSTDPSFIDSYVQGQRTGVAQQTLDQMIDEHLIREEAEARGITVTDDEIDERICGELSQATGATTDSDGEEASEEEAGEDTEADGASEAGEDADEDATEGEGAEADTGDEDAASEEGAAEEGAAEEGDAEDTVAPSDELVCALEGAELERAFETVLTPQLDQAGMGRRDYEEIVRAQIFRDKLGESLGEELDTTAEQVEIEYLLFTDESVADDALTALAAGDSWSDVSTRFERPEEPEAEDEAAMDTESEDEATDEGAAEGEEGDTEGEETTDEEADAEDESEDEATEEESEATEDEADAEDTDAAAEDEAAGEDEGAATDEDATEEDATDETGDDADAESEEGEATEDEADAEGDDAAAADEDADADTEGDEAEEGADEEPAAPSTPEPEPYAFDIAEPQWFTTEQLQTRLGLTQTEVEETFAMDMGGTTEALQGSQGFYILHVLDKDADRQIDEGELQRLKDGAIDEWLTETRVGKSSEISRFPTDGLIPEEPDWFVLGFNQLTSSLGGQAPLDLGDVGTSGDTSSP